LEVENSYEGISFTKEEKPDAKNHSITDKAGQGC
jgi:hypothetical protein